MAFEYNTAQLEWNIDGGAYTVLKPLSDGSEHNPEANSEQMSAGYLLYAGTTDSYTIMVPDMSKFDALRAVMLDDSQQGLVGLRFTDHDGNTETEEGFSVIVSKSNNFAPGSRNAFTAQFDRFFI